MKIGILTVYFADYGSFFQAYTLYDYLTKLGHDCELINAYARMKYSPRFNIGVRGTKLLPHFVQKTIADKLDVYRTYLNLRQNVSQLKISEKYTDIQNLSSKYDCIIIGSDELWSVTNPLIRFVPEYFGIHITCPIFSYATSGVNLKNPPSEILEKMKSGLSKFECISVRDKVTAEWVGNLVEQNIEIVLDPTLLNPCFEGKEKYKDKYILIYGEQFSQDHIDAIHRFAAQKKLPIKSVVWKHNWCDAYLETESAEELQDYYKSSEYVMTSTLHGTIFSIVNKRPFTSFVTELRGLKVQLLLEQLGLENRLFENGDIGEPLSYDAVDEKLAEWRKISEAYLKNALLKVSKKKG